MKSIYTFLLLLLGYQTAQAQMVVMSPAVAVPDNEVTITFDASQGNGQLIGAETVYMHHGVVTTSPTSTSWSNVIGNWGQDDGIGEMTPVSGQPNKWSITFAPSIREYFNVAEGTNIFRISAVFRSADGTVKGTMAAGNYPWGTVTASGDVFINLNVQNYLVFVAPSANETFVDPGETINIQANASSAVTSMKILLDQGSGFVEVANATSGTTLSYLFTPTQSVNLGIRITATINGENVLIQKNHNVLQTASTVVTPLPPGIRKGINYNPTDNSKATLVLEAPGKGFVYIIGDFNNWTPSAEYQMKKTPDGELFWLELSNLTPQQQYVFQYWVDGAIKIGDPYADQVADPWNDSFIEESVHPNLPSYSNQANGVATVLQSGQTPYQWSTNEANWQKPPVDHLVIYELHLRDFLASHSYADLIDTLDYLKRLGVDAIEMMPLNEFEGNDSWGYNPSYFFAPDKYYGTKNELKRFIDSAHVKGIPVILDIVLNHAYGQNPMVKLYYNSTTNKPAADNPWFNVNHVGPYSWGYDFNHESTYTQNFVDSVNNYWLSEYHFDGFRFDFTKGFTNSAPGGSIDGFDQSRINIITRMADKLRESHPDAYIILEHWGSASEENVLAADGMKMWRNKSYDYVPAANGSNSGNFAGMNATSHVSYFNSHDEQRLPYHTLNEGLSNGSYNVRNPLITKERMKMAAAFAFLFPGPKMIWQFDELGYDIDINFNGRVGRKPYAWGPNSLMYYEDSLRQHIYKAYQGILDVRNTVDPGNLNAATSNHKLTGSTRRLSYNTNDMDLVVLGNFGMATENLDPAFTQTGTWYDYFSGDSITVSETNSPFSLMPGQWHIFTTTRLSEGMPYVVETFENPVTITPYPFTQFDEITVRFDAAKAWKNGSNGLIGADSVYFHSGAITSSPDSSNWNITVGTLTADNIGLMTEVSDDIWEITLTPDQYYSLNETLEAFKLGMYFRDAANENYGYGFRNSVIEFNVESALPFITVTPPAFTSTDEITITFNTKRGNAELLGATSVYLHSSAGVVDTQSPQNTGWQNTTGNWGQDDGIGEMSPVTGEDDLWEITLTPATYYNLTELEHPYWIAAVFRNANGTVKGTGTPGEIENGFIASNLDFFIKNQLAISIEETPNQPLITLFPNPANDFLQITGLQGTAQLQIHNMLGQLVLNETIQENQSVSINHLPAGLFTFTFIQENRMASGRWVKK
jgi:glycosidase